MRVVSAGERRVAGRDGSRVVVTGMGVVTSLGPDLARTWERLVAGESGVRATTAFDPSRVESRISGEAREADPTRVLDRKAVRRTDRATHLSLLATQEALAQAGLPERLEGELADRTGAFIGTGFGGSATIFEEIRTYVERGPDRISPFFVPMSLANMTPGYVGIAFGARGPNMAPVSACASGGNAIGEAAETIRRGDADVMLAGGTEAAVVEGIIAGFAAMHALSTRNDDPAAASRPFDASRDGFVVAEGAGTLVLEALEHATARGARILAEVEGYGATADAHHVTLPPPGADGAVRAARRALEKAGRSIGEVDVVSAHATSTPEGDRAELRGMRVLFGDAAADANARPGADRRVAVTATKSALGHTLGAAGAIAAALTIQALQSGRVPPILNLDDPDPEAGSLDLVRGEARPGAYRLALVNAFGFGGQNSVLLFSKWGEA
ncbi:MAG: beta-ketoacyl-ACP synthase II [Chloroflexi bacterium]|nr:beta-ketoacyl-ACP synthase II [Chloroflexota bacterium]